MSNIFCIYKPKNWTSNDVVQKIKKELNLKKIGHGGTLDPLAEGALIIGVNEGTKELNNHLDNTKQYIATIEFTYQTDTLDLEGSIEYKSNVIPQLDDILNKLEILKNETYYQIPPKFSAIKINGKPAYKYARENKEIIIDPRIVKLINYEIISYNDKTLEIIIDVSKGFYVRSFARDLAHKLGTYATLVKLIRTKSGDLTIENSYTIEGFINEYKKISNQQK